jgi:L-asparaginase II
LAVKVADGAHRASALVALGLLSEHGLVDAEAYASLWNELAPKVLGGNQITGEYRLV